MKIYAQKSFLVFLTAIMMSSAHGQNPDFERLKATWSARFKAMSPQDWRAGYAAGMELAALPSSEGYEILRANWKPEVSAEARKQTFKGWVSENHPDVFKVLDLGMRDRSLDVQNWSITYLKDLAFIDFAEDFDAYPAWYKSHSQMSVKEVETEGILRALNAARTSNGAERNHNLRLLRSVDKLSFPGASPEILSATQFLFDTENLGQEGVAALTALIHLTQPSESFMKPKLESWLASPSSERRMLALQVISGSPSPYEFQPLMEFLEKSLKAKDKTTPMFQVGMAFGALEDLHAVPILIGAIDADNTYDTVYGLGYFGLTNLVGVSYDESHDGPWWKTWWAKNKNRFSAEIQNLPVPEFPHTASYKAPAEAMSSLEGKDPLSNLLASLKRNDAPGILRCCVSIAKEKDYNLVPDLIGLIESASSKTVTYDIGYLALQSLTAVEYRPDHDGNWWTAWWTRNRIRFPEDIRKRSIPAEPLITSLGQLRVRN